MTHCITLTSGIAIAQLTKDREFAAASAPQTLQLFRRRCIVGGLLAGSRKREHDGLVLFLEHGLASAYALQDPSLMRFAQLQPHHLVRGLVEKDAEAVGRAGDGSDQRELRALRLDR